MTGPTQVTIQDLFQPLIAALGKEHEEVAQQIIGKEASGTLAWGVRSGYLLWMRTYPGTIPTKTQVREWIAKGKGV